MEDDWSLCVGNGWGKVRHCSRVLIESVSYYTSVFQLLYQRLSVTIPASFSNYTSVFQLLCQRLLVTIPASFSYYTSVFQLLYQPFSVTLYQRLSVTIYKHLPVTIYQRHLRFKDALFVIFPKSFFPIIFHARSFIGKTAFHFSSVSPVS